MTGTAKTEDEEFQDLQARSGHGSPPTTAGHPRRSTRPASTAPSPSQVQVDHRRHQRNCKRRPPVLVGTVTIETVEMVSEMLKRRGIQHEVLNAKNHERGATIVAQAGRTGAVTIATNMAGRGVDILLGGNPEGLASRDSYAAKGLTSPEIPQTAWIEGLDMIKRGQDPTKLYETAGPRSSPRNFTRPNATKSWCCWWPARHRHRTPRSSPHRQPVCVAAPVAGDPGSSPLLPEPRRRPHEPIWR